MTADALAIAAPVPRLSDIVEDLQTIQRERGDLYVLDIEMTVSPVPPASTGRRSIYVAQPLN